MSQAIFDTDGNTYNQTAILTNNRFDQEKYDAVGPAWFSATNALFLLVDNLSIGAAIVHAGLFYGKDLYPLVKDVVNVRNIWKQGWRSILIEEEEDLSMIKDEHLYVLHSRHPLPRRSDWKMPLLSFQMRKSGYRNVPKFWFLLVLAGAFAMAMGKMAYIPPDTQDEAYAYVRSDQLCW
jgi:hypothetical protein